MPQFPDWISRLFGSGNAKGLSGEESANLDPSSYFGPRLHKHRAGGDLIDHPEQMWGGLRNHLRLHTAGSAADFTDVLVVVNSEDFARTFNQVAEPWADVATRALRARFEQFCADEGFELLFSTRGVRFKLIQDGGPEMGGEDFELEPGEFVTGLLQNLYAGASTTSRPVVAIHLNLPDVWEGYREVGRLYSDQVAFTLGNHWLDNFSHFALQEPALYRLQQYLDGNFVHIIDPELQDRYQVVNNNDAGANVLTITDLNGEAIAHLVLALMDSIVPDMPEPESAFPDRPQIGLPTPVVPEPTPSFQGTLDSIGHKTIVPESVQDRIFTLKEKGALLQKVHFRKFMRGYDVYVSSNGNLTTRAADRAVTFQVRQNRVALVVHKPTVLVDGRAAPLETPLPLDGSIEVRVGHQVFRYNDLSRNRGEPGWPYLGEIIRPSSNAHMVFGGSYGIGRDRRNKVQLPDEPHNDNIVWIDNSGASTIRARSGEISRSQFYTDSIMVASRHAEVDLTGEPRLHGIAKHCFTYVRRGERILSLYPTKRDGQREVPLQSGDEVLVGNCLFQVQYAPEDAAPRPMPKAPPPLPRAPAPPPPTPVEEPPQRLTAQSLAEAADDESSEVWHEQELSKPKAAPDPFSAPEPPPRRQSRPDKAPASLIDEILNARGPLSSPQPLESASSDVVSDDAPLRGTPSLDALLNERKAPAPDDLPAAGGLGEEGEPPPLPELSSPGFDSLMGLGESLDVEVVEIVDSVEEDSFDDLTDAPPVATSTDEDPLFLPGPSAPRQDFEVVPEALPETQERFVPVEIEPQTFSDEDDSGSTWNAGLLDEEPQPTETAALPEPPTPPKPEPTPAPTPAPPPSDPVEPTPPLLEPEPSKPAPQPAAPQPAKGGLERPTGIAIVDDDQLQVELARPARLVTIGWALTGDVSVGNHHGCDAVVPENRLDPDQDFSERVYFELRVRGTRGKGRLADPSEATLEKGGEAQTQVKGLDDVAFGIIRRDEDGDEDFTVELSLHPDFEVPDPRGRLLQVDLSDRIVAALFIRGLPLGPAREIVLGPIAARVQFDGSQLTLSDYLASYRLEDGRFAPFFFKRAQGGFLTVPEDGRPLVLQPGDLVIAGTEVLRFDLR